MSTTEAPPTASGTDDADPVAAVTAWLEEQWDPDLTVAEWWERLGTAGWSARAAMTMSKH